MGPSQEGACAYGDRFVSLFTVQALFQDVLDGAVGGISKVVRPAAGCVETFSTVLLSKSKNTLHLTKVV